MGSLPSKISGSRAAAILGFNKFKTPVQVWLDIMEELEPGFSEDRGYKWEPFEGNAATRLGNDFEDAIILHLENKSMTAIISREMGFIHNEHSFITCHVDGTNLHSNGVDYLYEGKTTNGYTYRDEWGEPGTDRIPQEYQIQIQHNMKLVGSASALVTVLVFPQRQEALEDLLTEKISVDQSYRWVKTLDEMGYFHKYQIDARPSLQDKIIQAEVDFWHNHVLTRIPPKPQNYEDIRALVIEPKGTILADETTERLATEYKDITKEMSTGNKRRAQLKTMILNYMRDKAETPIDDDSVEKWVLRNGEGKKLCTFDGKTYR